MKPKKLQKPEETTPEPDAPLHPLDKQRMEGATMPRMKPRKPVTLTVPESPKK